MFSFILGEVQQLQDDKQKSSCEVKEQMLMKIDFFCSNFLEFRSLEFFLFYTMKKKKNTFTKQVFNEQAYFLSIYSEEKKKIYIINFKTIFLVSYIQFQGMS